MISSCSYKTLKRHPEWSESKGRTQGRIYSDYHWDPSPDCGREKDDYNLLRHAVALAKADSLQPKK